MGRRDGRGSSAEVYGLDPEWARSHLRRTGVAEAESVELRGTVPVAEFRGRLRHARVSKRDRAEPVSLRYERGQVKHAGVFRELEDEMCAFGAEAGRSPDRVDALVWAVTALTEVRSEPRVGVL